MASCSPHAARYNRVVEEFNTHYSNAVLGFSMTLPGDYEFARMVKPKAVKSWQQWLHPAVAAGIHRRTTIFHAETGMEPHFTLLMASVPTNILENSTWQELFVPVYVNEYPAFEAFDSIRAAYYYALALPDQVLLIIGKAHEPTRYRILLRELRSGIIPTIGVGASFDAVGKKSPYQVADEAYKGEGGINYLAPLMALQQRKGHYHDTRQQESAYVQAYLTFACGIKGAPEVAACMSQYENVNQARVRGPVANWDQAWMDQAALDTLMERARDRQVVMFNELHFSPEHRALVRQLLPQFKELGFTSLAMEALAIGDTQLMNRGFPSQESGYYVREPEMAKLVRDALRLGFRLVPYEDTTGTNREKQQARNLIEGTLRRSPQGKVLVLAGFGHIHEGEEEGRKRMMAAEFHRLSGIDPLTIDQVELNKFRFDLQEHGHSLALFEQPHLPNTTNLIETDLYLVNAGGLSLDQTIQMALPQPPMEIHQPHYVAIYLTQEWNELGDQAVPYALYYNLPDQVSLLPGSYWMRVIDDQGHLLVELPLETNP